MTAKAVIHLIPNAHLDPVWLWDWREGFTEMIATTRTVLDLMDEFPDLTFMRGEAMLYRHIEENDPVTFRRLRRQIEAGRWDVVGGTMLQSDMNMPATETFIRHMLLAQRYFQDRFGLKARVGWSADCFGHTHALPDLLAAGGMEAYAYTRPKDVPPQASFWWEGPAGGRLLVHHPPTGGYYTDRDATVPRLDKLLAQAEAGPCRNVPCFMGLGNHGGHPTRRMIAETQAWAQAHPQVDVRYSTLTRFFDALRSEAKSLPESAVPVFRGEANFAPRGIYAAGARFKFLYRKSEAAVDRAERIASAVAASDPAAASAPAAATGELRRAWEAILFNTFHDIMPGSSIERAFDEQTDWLGQAPHAARTVEQSAVYDLARRIDTRVRPPAPDMPSGLSVLLFNPHPWSYSGPVEVEACLDYRPLLKFRQTPYAVPIALLDPDAGQLPHQQIETEHMYAPRINLRTRVIAPVEIPAMGWKVIEYAYDETAQRRPPPGDPATASDRSITCGPWQVAAEPGDAGVRLLRAGKALLGAPGLTAVTVEDRWGIWGDFNDSPESLDLNTVRDAWRVTRVEVTERGPIRATLNVRLEGGRSRLDLALSLCHGRDAVDVRARVFWDERCARLKLIMPGGFSRAEYDTMGGTVPRGSLGEVPGGRWVRLDGAAPVGFASDALYGFNLTPSGALQATIVRATRYTADAPANAEEHPWRGVLDTGELRFSFLLTPDVAALPRLAAELEQPPLVAHVLASPGEWPRTGGCLSLDPDGVRLLALKPVEDGVGWVLRIQSFAAQTVTPQATWMGRPLTLAPICPRALATYRLRRTSGGDWTATATDILENPRVG